MSLFYFSGNQAMSSNTVLCTDCFYLKRDDKNVICTHPSSSQLSVKWNFSRKLYETTSESIRPMPEIPAHVQWVGMCDPQRGLCGWDECTYAHGKAERDQWNDIRRLNRKRALGNTSYTFAFPLLIGLSCFFDG